MKFVDFLNHGILPFVGRTPLLDRLIRFWNQGAGEEGMTVMVMIGEAGVGKSRLVEETVLSVGGRGGAVVQIRLYPESPTALVPLLSRGLWRYAEAHPDLRIETDESFGGVLSSLRRLCRLRPTILIIEDLHLLGGAGVGDLATLLDALADEPLPVLMTARPLELAARGVLERHRVTECDIPGIDHAAMATLWKEIFGGEPRAEEVDALMGATGGNPLAVRSALRGSVRAGALTFDESVGHWRMAFSRDAFAASLERSVALLSEGMAAHLDEDETAAAGSIALLGEVVARETVMAAVDDHDLVDRLVFKGILKTSGVAVPHLHGGDRSRHPILAFTHSLLHRRFVDSADVSTPRLVSLIALGLPLYSALPFQIISRAREPIDVPLETALRCIDRGLETALALDYGPDWGLASSVLDTSLRLFEMVAPTLEEKRRNILDVRLLLRRAAILHRDEPIERKQEMVARMLELTDDPDDEETCRLRLAALVNDSMSAYWRTGHSDSGAMERIRAFVERYPALRRTEAYLAYLNQIVMWSSLDGEIDRLRQVEREAEEMVRDPTLDDEFRVSLKRAVYPDLLLLFGDTEELARRMEDLAELESGREDRYTSGIHFCKISLLERTGWLRKAAAACREAIPYFRDRSILLNLVYAERVELTTRLVEGMGFERGAAEGERICGRGTPAQVEQQRYLMGVQIATAALLTGRIKESADILPRFLSGDVLPYMSLRLGLARDRDEMIRFLDEGHDRVDERYGSLLTRLAPLFDRENTEGVAIVKSLLVELREFPLLQMSDLLARIALLRVIRVACDDLDDELAALGREVALAGLEWLGERDLSTAIRALLEISAPFLARRDLTIWRARGVETRETEGAERGEIRMLGVIEINRGEGESARPKGIRLRTLLGLMVADRLLDSPLAAREFIRLVAGQGADPDDARKTLNLAVHRLRETIGHNGILTDGETPRLNGDLFDVDLWKIDLLLDRVDRAVRDGALHRAHPMLSEALRIWHGEIPFPSLYDEFFEAARDDFENRMRGTALRLGRALMREGDAAGTEELLRAGLEAMPDEPELAELLGEALSALGKRVEAERLRLTVDL